MLSKHKIGTPDGLVGLQRCSWRGLELFGLL